MNQHEPKAMEPECIHCGHEPELDIRLLIDHENVHPDGDWMRGIFVEGGECMWHRVSVCENPSCESSVGDVWL